MELASEPLKPRLIVAPALIVVVPEKLFAAPRVRAPPAMVKPEVEKGLLIAPERVPDALVMVRVFCPRTVVPVPVRFLTVTLEDAAEISNVPLFVIVLEFAMLPPPTIFKVPALITV
ncbi:MAG TPA: hypothetical protein VJM78_08600 [Rhizomicrobium sp.]|nr:hypothetical protein [Rhizomicrobium sp.]